MQKYTAKEIMEAAEEAGFSFEDTMKIVKKLWKVDPAEVILSKSGLEKRTWNALKRIGIRTEEELIFRIDTYGIKRFKKTTRNFGEKSYQDLKARFPWIAEYE